MLRVDAVPGLQGFSLSRFLDQTQRSLNTYAPLANMVGNATGVAVPGFVGDAQSFLNQLMPPPAQQVPPPAVQRPFGMQAPAGIIGTPRAGRFGSSVQGKPPLPVWAVPAMVAGGVLLLALVIRR